MQQRVDQLRQSLRLDEKSAFFTYTPHHLYYLTGFTGGEGYLIIDKNSVILLVDGRYTTQAQDEVWDGVKVVLFSDIFTSLPQIIGNVSKLYIEENFVTISFFNKLKSILTDVEFLKADDVLNHLRMYKDEYEKELIEKAIDIAQKAFLKTLEVVRVGVTERDIAAELSYQMKKMGADKESFDIIVASGYRGALPHGIASNKKIASGELIVIDWGAFYRGYVSDLTRMVVMGNVSDEAEYVLYSVRDAQSFAIENACCCMTAKEIDALARKFLEDKGLSKYFTHSLGHGIGVEIHEKPRISYKSDEIVGENVIFTIEPGVYIPNKFGVRIEDDVVMTSSGVVVLSSLDKIYRL